MAAWLAAATNAPVGDVAVGAPAPGVPAARGAAPPVAAAEELAADLERLRQRPERVPALRMSARNPFSLARPRSPASSVTLDPSDRSTSPVASRRPPGGRPPLDLIGIATEETADGARRTGILTTSGGDVLLVRAGDRVPGGYSVDAVDRSAVTLVDGSGERLRLALP